MKLDRIAKRGMRELELMVTLGCGIHGVGMAQITFDGSIGGPAGALTGPNFQIPHNRGEIAGGNLFHSFSTFDLARGQSATFTGPASVNNILARVTGGPSTIQGTVRSGIQGANLFLINPAGIVFGQGAQIDVTGAFRATTADFIELADGRRFTATPDGSVALLSAAPESFGFLSGSPHAGTLRVEAPSPGSGVLSSGLNGKGQDMALVGRQVEIVNSYLKSAGGTISLSAVGEGVTSVALDPPPRAAALDPALAGDVSITGSAVSVSGASGGEIVVRGGRIVIDGAGTGFVQSGAQFDTFSGIDADAKSAGGGGEIRLDSAGDIVLRNNARVASFSRSSLDGGTIAFRAGGAMSLESGADVVASSTAAGNGGTIWIGAASLTIDGTGATRATRLSAQSNSTATGNAGSIEVDVDGLLELKEGGSIVTNTFSRGAGGSIRIEAGSLTAFQGDDPSYTGIASSTSVPGSPTLLSGYGDAGSLTVDVAGRIELRDSATIESTTTSDGNGGSVLVRAGSLFIEGAEELGRTDRNEFLTGILGLTTLRGTGALGSGVLGGNGGDVRVEVAGAVELVRGGQIDTSSFGGGNSGQVHVSGGTITADRAGSNFFTGIASDTEAWDDRARPDAKWSVAGGRAGTVTVTASESIQLLNGANISSSTAGSGDAGDVVVTAPAISISGSGSDEVYTPGPQSGIVALSETGRTDDAGYVTPPATGDAGSVRVTLSPGAGLLEITKGGKISAESLGSGAGGSVEITAEGGTVLVSDGGKISARSELAGDAGQVSLMAGEVRIGQGGLVESLNSGSGDAGGVELNVRHMTILGGGIQSLNSGSGKAGRVSGRFDELVVGNQGEISVRASRSDAGDLTMTIANDFALSGGSVVSGTAGGSGNGGDLVITAGGSIQIDGSEIVASTLEGSTGQGGSIGLEASELVMENGAGVSASSFGDGGGGMIGIKVPTVSVKSGSGISSISTGAGRAGNVELAGKSLEVTGGSEVSVLARRGDAGNLSIVMSEGFELRNGSQISGTAGGSGNGGDLVITAGGSIQIDGSGIVASTLEGSTGDGGNISLDSGGNLRLIESNVSASATGDGGNLDLASGGLLYATRSDLTARANGNGGNISFTGAQHLVLDHTPVSANAVALDGGTITVETRTFFANESPLDVSSRLGAPGTVSIQTLDALNGGQEERNLELLDPADILQPDCTKRAASNASSFVRAGRGGTRRLPGGVLPSFRIIE